MAWFQQGFAAGFAPAGRDKQEQDLQAEKIVDMERSVLGERNSRQIPQRQQAVKAGPLQEGRKIAHNQENGADTVPIPKGKGGRSRRPAITNATAIVNLMTGQFRPKTQPWVDIDADKTDVLGCTTMANEIVQNMFLAEKAKLPSAEYMELRQPDISPDMRKILIDWLVEVAQEYKLAQETLHLSVRLIDRFLSKVAVARHQLQLVGVTCMFIASKFEEVYAPQAEDFSFITEETYKKPEIVEFERIVLMTLDFELNMPTQRFFLNRFVKAANACLPSERLDGRLEALCGYLSELSLLEYESLRALPSTIAAAVVLLAQFCLYRACWTPTLQHYTTYSPSQLRQVVQYLYVLYRNARSSQLPAVRDKYSQPKYLFIARADPPAELPDSLFYPVNVL